ncbi:MULTISPECIES: mechanosensitive ion channel domain-containing protein [unclassified Pseudodesulfovibrio]|uniref:mechanosensitive ion channel family protein n=1 Tax=unclassified Pseudodesulfovibrio TaxID=2661612 RepID=UPI000FEB6E9F|nr:MULTISPECIES: mechanosensitive ion channel domain-containing protein [unclassified Pseudodesulfovibrio]MCJ2162961.1 mechanosensitive ion channel [Pseudodesulfovibrio sp. S3-i]RWU06960.1 mechanosensitive ion channel family protein [Pseudodesulfovibrio sp. S3]
MDYNFESLVETLIFYVTEYGVRILIALVIFVVGRMVARTLAKASQKIMLKANVDETLSTFLKNIVFYALLAAVVIAALGQAGINITSFLAVLGAAGLAIGLALKDSLSNFAAGVMLILLKFFKKGDYVTVGGESGTVTTINIFNTVLTTPDNKVITVPNSAVLGGTITNVTANDTRRVDLVIGIGYDDDLLKAKQVLQRIVSEEPRVLAEPAPLIEVLELGNSSVNFVVRPWCKTGDYWGVYFALTEKVKLVFDQEGISIPYPQQDVHIYPTDKA